MARRDLPDWLKACGAPDDVISVMAAVAGSAVVVSRRLAGGQMNLPGAGTVNVQGEVQKPMDRFADGVFTAALIATRAAARLISEERDEPLLVPGGGSLTVMFDPLDGSSNLDINAPVGSIVAVARGERELPTGDDLVAAAYVLYGAATVLVVACGGRVGHFVLQPKADAFGRVSSDMRMPASNREFAINASRRRHWLPQTANYVEACLTSSDGYNMRWNAAFVAEVHRILMRGGIFLYPLDGENTDKGGRLRLLYEGYPMAFIAEAAGGQATTGAGRILDVPPTSAHQRVSVVIGSSDEVDRYLA